MKFDVPNRSEFVLQEHEGVEGGGWRGDLPGNNTSSSPRQILRKCILYI